MDEKFGAASFIVGSVYAAFLAVLFGAPLGLAGAVFMAKVAPRRVRDIMRRPMTCTWRFLPSCTVIWIDGARAVLRMSSNWEWGSDFLRRG